MEGEVTSTGSSTAVFISEQWSVQRGNLLGICRMCVKSLVDKAAFEPITDTCPHLLNFCTIVEHLFTHRIELRRGLFSGGEPISFWLVLCRVAPRITITSIQDMEEIHSELGKGRAWIRLALVQKKLSSFVASLLPKRAQLESFYLPGAFLTSDLMTELSGTLKCLDAIDFNLCLRGQDFDFGSRKEICYTPYLRFRQSSSSIADDTREARKLGSKVISEEDEDVGEDESVSQLRESFIAERDQKNYFEELVSVRDKQLSSVRSELTSLSRESEKQKRELEDVVLELQKQITSLQTELRASHRAVSSVSTSNGQSSEEQSDQSPRKRTTSLFSSFLGLDN
ncbi:RUN domain-containing protein 3A-like [Halichondria panicea]|uniref:RUN domain-containing protein 3A-like n=1 Tax=Halichondria panicea TaxID=6063 RepID=UPI00312B4B85